MPETMTAHLVAYNPGKARGGPRLLRFREEKQAREFVKERGGRYIGKREVPVPR